MLCDAQIGFAHFDVVPPGPNRVRDFHDLNVDVERYIGCALVKRQRTVDAI